MEVFYAQRTTVLAAISALHRADCPRPVDKKTISDYQFKKMQDRAEEYLQEVLANIEAGDVASIINRIYRVHLSHNGGNKAK